MKRSVPTPHMEYRITGQEDGSWIIRSFLRDVPLGAVIRVATPDQAWKIWMMLNGYHYSEPFKVELKKEKAS